MADKQSQVNTQVVDSVTEAHAASVGSAPKLSAALLDTVMAETVGLAMHNAVTAQQNAQMVANAAVAATCARLLAGTRGTTPPPPKQQVAPDQVAAPAGERTRRKKRRKSRSKS